MTSEQLRQRLDSLLAEKNRPAAVRESIDAVATGTITVPELYVDVLSPVMTETGSRWQHGDIRVWEEHFASATVRTIIEALYPYVLDATADIESNGRAVLLACPPREQHDLGLRMLADRFALAGWTAHYLGTDTPVEEICRAATELEAELIVLSASTHFNRVLLRGHVDAVKKCSPNARVLVGGSAFTLDQEWPASELFDPEAFDLPPTSAASADKAGG